MDQQLQLSIGEKIRSLRIQKRMTQSALAGSVVTRNMLSLIENGNAMPSLPTLLSLAQVLEVPVGYFFAGSPKEVAQFTKSGVIAEIHRTFSAGEYSTCLDICASLSEPDEEILLLVLYCRYFLAETALRSSMLATATTHLNEALRVAKRCIYTPIGFIPTVSYLLTLIHTVVQDKISKDLLSPEASRSSWVSSEFLVYVHALDALNEGDLQMADALRESGLITSGVYLNFLHAKATLYHGDIKTALPFLEKVLNAPSIGFFTARHALTALEMCADAAGDYKMAYKCSSEKVHLFEKFST